MFGKILDWIFKFLLGDDIFISYSRADGATYASGLASRLADLAFSCKLDQWERKRQVKCHTLCSLNWLQRLRNSYTRRKSHR